MKINYRIHVRFVIRGFYGDQGGGPTNKKNTPEGVSNEQLSSCILFCVFYLVPNEFIWRTHKSKYVRCTLTCRYSILNLRDRAKCC